MTKLSVRSAISSVHDAVRTQLWPLPTLGIAVAVVLGVALPYVDARVDDHLPGWLTSIVFGGDADAARTVLDAVASSLITVTSLTFSLTVVTLQLASSQFSPRLLRTFTQDLFVQTTLTVFLATFTFSLTVLRSVRSNGESARPFIPRLAVTTSYVLAVASVIALVLFLAHLTRQIRVETMLHNVHRDASSTLANNLRGRDDEDSSRSPLTPVPTFAVSLPAQSSGFLQRINRDELVRAVADADVLLSIDRQLGSFVVEGTPLASVWRADGHPVGAEVVDQLQKKMIKSVHTGPERTAAQDVGYGLRQLTDVVNKALSPGINDPTTAIHALGHVSSLLVQMMKCQLGPQTLRDAQDNPRVVLDHPDFDHFLDLALAQPRHYGKADSQVTARLYELLGELGWHASAAQQPVIVSQLASLRRTAAAQDVDELERQHLTELDAKVVHILARTTHSPGQASGESG